MRVVAVANQKGGVGKTTTVMQLAAVAAENSRVLVVDVDPQRSAAVWAEDAGEALPFDFTEESDPAILRRLRELDYDVIFVDTPGSLRDGDVLGATLDASDFVILPMEAQPMSVKPLVNTIRDYVRPRDLPYRVLISRYDSRSGDSQRQSTEELLDGAGIPRFNAVVREYRVHSFAPAEGKVLTQISESRQSAKAIDDFRKVALELMTLWAHEGVK